jgi:hypothetical protein
MPVINITGNFTNYPGGNKQVIPIVDVTDRDESYGRIGIPGVIWDIPKKIKRGFMEGCGFGKPAKIDEKKGVPEITKPDEKKGNYRSESDEVLEHAYKSMLSFASKKYDVSFMSMKDLYDFSYDPNDLRPAFGYEGIGPDGKEIIILAHDAPVNKKLEALSHELVAKRYKSRGISHKEFDKLDGFYRFRDRVIDAYKSKAMRELRRSDVADKERKEAPSYAHPFVFDPLTHRQPHAYATD